MKSKVIFWLLSVLGIGILTAATIFVVLKLQDGPEIIPTHFNAFGEPDAFGSTEWLLFPVVVGWILYVFLMVLSFSPKFLRMNKPNGWSVLPLKRMITVLNLILAAVLSYIVYCEGECIALGVWFLPVYLAAVFLTVIIGLAVSYKMRGKGE